MSRLITGTRILHRALAPNSGRRSVSRRKIRRGNRSASGVQSPREAIRTRSRHTTWPSAIRAHDLKLEFVYQGQAHKMDAIRDILAKTGITIDQLCLRRRRHHRPPRHAPVRPRHRHRQRPHSRSKPWPTTSPPTPAATVQAATPSTSSSPPRAPSKKSSSSTSTNPAHRRRLRRRPGNM